MTGSQPPETAPAADITALHARAAELGVTVSEYAREALWRVRGEEAWARALAQVGAEARRSAPDVPDYAAAAASAEPRT